MGKPSRDKGARVEREMVHALNYIPGVVAERVPLSGAAGGSYVGDISFEITPGAGDQKPQPMVAEVKARKSGDGFKTLERWLGSNDMLFLKRNRAEPLLVMPLATLRRILGVQDVEDAG